MLARWSAALICAASLATPAYAARPALKVERVVLLMRHGVRPPTKSPAMPAGVSADPWPAWDVAPGWLTAHGAAAIENAAKADRSRFADEGVLPREGCPAAGTVTMYSDSGQRTVATGDAYLAGLAPDCGIANRRQPQGASDPIFSSLGQGPAPFDPAAADAAVAQTLAPEGVAGVERRQHPALAAVDRITCGAQTAACGVTSQPSAITPAEPGKRPKLTGALDQGSTVAQILLLEYAEGKPMSEVGWGRASAADIALVGSLHSSEFAVLARPRYLAQAHGAGIADLMLKALRGPGPRLSLIVGHDTNVAALAGLLDLHWSIPGFAPDDPAPGGALAFELLRDKRGRLWVQAFYRSQSLDQIRSLASDPPLWAKLTIPGCSIEPDGLCPLDGFASRMSGQ